MPSRPDIGKQAPRFELSTFVSSDREVHRNGRWSLDDHLGGRRAVVLIFHRHIH